MFLLLVTAFNEGSPICHLCVPLACTFGVNAITKFIAIEDDVSNETSVYREKSIPMIALLI